MPAIPPPTTVMWFLISFSSVSSSPEMPDAARVPLIISNDFLVASSLSVCTHAECSLIFTKRIFDGSIPFSLR